MKIELLSNFLNTHCKKISEPWFFWQKHGKIATSGHASQWPSIQNVNPSEVIRVSPRTLFFKHLSNKNGTFNIFQDLYNKSFKTEGHYLKRIPTSLIKHCKLYFNSWHQSSRGLNSLGQLSFILNNNLWIWAFEKLANGFDKTRYFEVYVRCKHWYNHLQDPWIPVEELTRWRTELEVQRN
jgi:hypothetical protein